MSFNPEKIIDVVFPTFKTFFQVDLFQSFLIFLAVFFVVSVVLCIIGIKRW